jgi:hypothetical protein
MSASRWSATKIVSVAAAVLMLSTASYASSYQQLFPNGAAPHADSHAQYRSGGNGFYSTYPGEVPHDFSSSHVCINGYRWLTREFEWGESPSENAIPVRC